ncbi:sacsin-like, partial [Crassostrea angulata]|uniref:sacsin-like n=1 Tax=Magallana angulata TaxID=2784310 RepID=UPI0022B09484
CVNVVGCKELIVDLPTLKLSFDHINVLHEIGVLEFEEVLPSTVIKQLTVVCKTVSPDSLPDASRQLLEKICTEIYEYLDNKLKCDPSLDIDGLKDVPCLFIDNTFIKPNQTAFTIPVKCSPKLYGLDRIQWKRNEFFLKMLGVKKTFKEEDVIPILKEMSESCKGVLDDKSLELACNLVELLASVYDRPVLPEEYKNICIPDEHGFLTPIRILCLDDSTLLQKGKSLKFIHPKIRGKDATVLGVQSKLSGSLMHNYIKQWRPFGQKEELSDRIKRILLQYPLSETVLKEMLQNADDAKASEVMFITDFNTYETEKIFDSKWEPLQGPALLVYNNSYFTEKDIAGIQHLGRGTKESDPTKSGQYGVGFNAVYHITDVPSFLSKSPDGIEDTLCVMDPNCKYAPGADEISPGARFTELHDLRRPFRDAFKCYHEDILLKSTGTVFRLPLRTKTFAEKSELSNKEVTERIIRNMLHNLESEISKSLLFLRNVRKITIANITKGKLNEKTCTELVISEKCEKEKLAFDEYVVQKATQFQQKKEIFNFEQKSVQYDVTLKKKSHEDRQWCIIQTFGFNSTVEIPRSVKDAFDDDDLGLLPQGGVAMPLDTTELIGASAFCFLPLPCETGLTMHVNGHFSLDNESRRGLWKEDKKAYRTEWNNLLLCHVIAPTYAKALESLKKTLCLDSTTNDVRILRNKIDKFHSFFPDIKKATDQYWKNLICAVYKYISVKQMKIFLSSCSIYIKDPEVLCYSLNEENGNVLFIDDTNIDEGEKIRSISKNLGAKLVDTPSWVCSSIENTGITITKFNPDSLISYLKSPSCHIKSMIEKNKPLELKNSPLKTSDHVKSCIKFCMKSENFSNEIEGLPLCLLESGNLVLFSTNQRVLLTSFSELIPESKEQLLHHDLHELFQERQLGCIEEMHLEQLVELLPRDINYDSFRHKICQWNPSQSNIPNKLWLRILWKFLSNEVGETEDQIEIKRILTPILPWSIIPAIQECGRLISGDLNEVEHKLFPLENANHVINLSSFQSTLEKSFKKLKLPVLDSDTLLTVYPLCHLVASQDRVYDVLECLSVHRQLIFDCDELDMNDCYAILEFFAGELNQLLEMPNSQTCLTMLRKLPLFMTVHKWKISLEENRDILALPSGLPEDGMIEWAERSSKILLHQNDRLQCIFERFNVTEQSICQVYVKHILPHFYHIPEENRMKHLEYIRDELLRTSGNYDEEQTRLIDALRELPFLRQNDNTYKLASYYFDPFNELMKVMCDDSSKFPPNPFSSHEWYNFMTLVGMKSKITTNLFLDFALQQELQGQYGFSKDLEQKSRCLVRHLFKFSHSEEFLQRVSEIKFIIPDTIGDLYVTICAYPSDDSNQLISFRHSVQCMYLVTAWTQCRLLPSWIDYEAFKYNFELAKLGVQAPTTDIVMTHIKTVCKSLGNMSESYLNKLCLKQISYIMKKFYEYASKPEVISSLNVRTFQNIPFVFLSEFPGLFPCEQFARHLNKKYEMKPYLMAVPDEFLGFIQLFETLGVTRNISSKTFANVLHQIHSIGDELNPNELKIVHNAMKFFFKLLPSDDNLKWFDIKDLFLLSRDGRLVNSKSLVFMNLPYNDWIHSTEEDFDILSDISGMGNETLQIKLKKLPSDIRPKFISDIIKTDTDIRQVEIQENDVSKEINDFFSCDQFVNGVLRLLRKEQTLKTDKHPSDEMISSYKESLRRIQMVCATGMQTVYTFEGKEIERQPCLNCLNVTCQNGEKTCLIYANFFESNDAGEVILDNYDHISRAIRECTSCSFITTGSLLSMICAQVKCPRKIEFLLNSRCVPNLNMEVSHRLPKPGDIVEIRWHSILDNDFISFDPGEYVAYISGKNKRGDVEYKYAIVKEKLSCAAAENSISLLQAYIVEIEVDNAQNMKIYELYKFNRSKNSKDESTYKEFQARILHKHEGSEDANVDAPCNGSRALDEIFEDIRKCLKHAFTLSEDERGNICRRIMSKWIPDENQEDVQRATEVFRYIRRIIELLEDGEDVDVDDTKEPSSRRRPWSEKFFNETDRFYEREKEYQRRSKRSSSSNDHLKNIYLPNPQPYQANIWLDEAKYDMRFALQSGNAKNSYFSWICFTSYQSAEKALTAWQYNEDANRVNRCENLLRLPQSCPEELRCLARELHTLTQGPKRMRYPEGGHQPSKAYTRAQASKAMELANQIIEKVDECL